MHERIVSIANHFLRLRVGGFTGNALVFLIVALARIIYVSLYATAVPFWDQWDEVNQQFLPWLDGSWHPLLLFAPHNEHRILFTRLIDLFLFVSNSHTFDNLVGCYANALLYAGMWTLAYAMMTRNEANRTRRWILALAVIVMGILPFDWENALVGFQSQFYLMEIVAITMFGIASYRAPSPGTFFMLAVLAVASLFTMAAGVLAAPAVCAIVVLRAWRGPFRPGFTLMLLAAMLVVTFAGLAIIPRVPADVLFNARGPLELVRALLTALIWPLKWFDSWKILFAAVIWAPTVAWMWRFARSRRGEPDDFFATGLALWVLLQFLAIAHARGHGMLVLIPRYTEIPALGLAANFWLAMKLAGSSKWPRYGMAIIAISLITLLARTPNDFKEMVQRYRFSLNETANVSRYLAGRGLPNLPPSDLNLPYPVASRLKQFLDMPDIRAMLPPSLFVPPESGKRAPLSTFASATQRYVRGWFPDATDVNSTESAGYTNQAHTRFGPYIGVIPDHPTNAQCALDGIDGAPAADTGPIEHGAIITFSGWAGDGRGELPKQPLLVLESEQQSYAAPISTDVRRPDVAQALKSAGLADSGYDVAASLTGVPPGRYALYISQAGNADMTCALHRTLIVK